MSEVVEKAKEVFEKNNLVERIREEYGEPVFLQVWGSHAFGFPSPTSDIDVRGVYVAPLEKFLGIRERVKEPTFKLSQDGLEIEVEEVGHCIDLVSGSDGNRIGWVSNPLNFYTSSEFGLLREFVNGAGRSKELKDYCVKLSLSILENERIDKLKKSLHAARILMEGINFFETGETVLNIKKLNEKFGYSIVDDLVIMRKKGNQLPDDCVNEFDRVYGELYKRLVAACNNANCAESPDVSSLNDYLVGLRMEHR